jgi:hypothetical protein
MSKLIGAALDRAVANAMGLKSVHNCEKWRTAMTEEDDDTQVYKKPWVGLTDDDLLQIKENLQAVEGESLLRSLTKAIEQALKEKNT